MSNHSSNIVKEYLIKLFKDQNISVPANRRDAFERFIQKPETVSAVNLINQTKNQLMANWKIQERITEIINQPVRILNASVGKSYEAKLDFNKLGWTDIATYRFEGLGEAGLSFNEQQQQITGNPKQSGDINIGFLFKLQGQADDEPLNKKIITLIINPDPKSLWKTIDNDKNDPYWKEDAVTQFEPIGDRHILVSSKRGRSHANVGSFREDDFAFKDLGNGWSIVVVADGAGSAKLSRKGSQMACNGIVEFFTEESATANLQQFDELLAQHNTQTDDSTQNKIKLFVYNNLGKAVFTVHKKLESFAAEAGATLKDLSSTLIFTLFKKYESGYVFLSFGVGDCPMAVINREVTEVTLLNWLDVGEFGGGTRFITMPEIFKSDKFATRFSFKQLKDFSYLMLMSDGIYDPKFIVEASLPNITKWQDLLNDLGGNNEEGVKVDLSADNADIIPQLSAWMDFWSAGNHDDRTLAIVF
ncbi:PP2C family serine/threonine-protein phosphatase [Mucilaginibacter sp. CSA2-8R]|uniref:PP2C family serine/threonine-protein phosphatase n=1 Tax=Mucilaginibacter sp. CSA2-8R TaxID=3141542 RepID=UPI00315CFDBA